MKKGVLSIVLLFACLLLVGCGEKTEVLSCSYSGFDSGIAYIGTEDFTFKGKKVNDFKLTIKFDLSSIASNKDVFDQAVDALRMEYSKAIEPGVTTTVYPEGNYAIAIFTINPTTFDGYFDYMQQNLKPIFETEVSASEVKPQMESRNFTCSIK